MGGESVHLRPHFLGSHLYHSATDYLRAAAVGAEARADGAGVAVNNVHVLHWDAEEVGQHLCECGLVALAVRGDAGGGGDSAILLYGDLGVLPAADPADLYVERE